MDSSNLTSPSAGVPTEQYQQPIGSDTPVRPAMALAPPDAATPSQEFATNLRRRFRMLSVIGLIASTTFIAVALRPWLATKYWTLLIIFGVCWAMSAFVAILVWGPFRISNAMARCMELTVVVTLAGLIAWYTLDRGLRSREVGFLAKLGDADAAVLEGPG
jgi:hypothetical protein